jgi:hypothetical protein
MGEDPGEVREGEAGSASGGAGGLDGGRVSEALSLIESEHAPRVVKRNTGRKS